MAGKSVGDVFNKIIKDSEKIMYQSIKKAAKQTQSDIVNEAHSCLKKYYENYTPTMYNRTKSLHKAIVPIFEDRSNGKNISFRVGVEYDPSMLEGVYASNSWYHQTGDIWRSVIGYEDDAGQGNGVPEPEWIVNNFYQGIHPTTDPVTGLYKPVKDNMSSRRLMRIFVNSKSFIKRINQHVNHNMLHIIKSRF